MQVRFPDSAGLDVHKASVVANVIIGYDEKGEEIYEGKRFGTMTCDLLQLADWLQEHRVTHVAIESTGEYWKPVYNILEDLFTAFVVNSHHAKNVPGRKTDDNDSQWLTKLMTFGLLSASFVPPQGQRELREMTRARSSMVRERVNLANRLQKTLESANIKLTCVLTDIQGKSARAMLAALVAGQTNTQEIADLALGRLRSKKDALERALDGRFNETHRFIVRELLIQIDSLDETIARFNAQIEKMCLPFEQAVAHLDTIPGIGKTAAQQIVAEIGVDMNVFATSGHLAAWAGVAPGNNQSAGKTLSSRTRQGNRSLQRTLVEAAHSSIRVKDTYLSAQYHRLVGRRGKRRALIAVAHSILVIVYHLIKRNEDYKELGGNYFDLRRPDKVVQNMVSRLQQLGYDVQLGPKPEAAAA
jgi:transposase